MNNKNSASETVVNPKVSILLLTYNQEKFIEQALLSVLSVDYENIEIIISDDASKDGTGTIIDSIFSRYSGDKKILINKNAINLGIAKHIDKLLSIASGELIVFAAGDDLTYKHRIKRIVEEWVAHGCKPDAICSSADIIDAQGKSIGMLKSGVITNDLDSELKYLFGGFIGCTEAVTKRLVHAYQKLSREVIGSNKVVSEDRIFAFRAYMLGGILCIADRLVAYRVSESSVSNNISLLFPQAYENRRNYRIVELDRCAVVLEQYISDVKYLYINNKIDEEKYSHFMRHVAYRKENLDYQRKSIDANLKSRLSVFNHLIRFHGFGFRSTAKLLLALIAPKHFMSRFY